MDLEILVAFVIPFVDFTLLRLDKKNGYRVYTTLQNKAGEFIVVGVDVKNAGRNLEINAISTIFGRRADANLPTNETVIYESKEITPEQSSLLNRPNSDQYPTEQELSTDKVTESTEPVQTSDVKNEGETQESAAKERAD